MTSTTTRREEYLTIIAASAGEAMAQFKAQGLDRLGYVIAGPIGRHRVTVVSPEGSKEFMADAGSVAATFRRSVPV